MLEGLPVKRRKRLLKRADRLITWAHVQGYLTSPNVPGRPGRKTARRGPAKR